MKNEGRSSIKILLIAVIVIVILALIVFLNIQTGRKAYNVINPGGRINDANNRSRVSNIKAIFDALQMYYSNNGTYPAGLNKLPSPLITNAPYGYSVTGSTIGVPNCVSGSGTIPNATVTVSSSCTKLTAGSVIYKELSKYISVIPTGNYYLVENSTGNKVVVFATGMRQGITSDTEGYPVAWYYN
ncbi:hypothetical protein M1145_02685 [Patescibacteria group bacterium]|nr:hypothetical protein [Patescibacteria group bacterium]